MGSTHSQTRNMSTSLSVQDILFDFTKEFSINSDGETFASRRAVARMCGVQHNSINNLLKSAKADKISLHWTLQPIAGQSFEGGQIPDYAAVCLIQYYAYKGKELPQKICSAFMTKTLREMIQFCLGWKQSPVSVIEQQLNLICSQTSSEWRRKFIPEFYQQLARLTGLTATGNSRPIRWAQLTKKFIYDPMPLGVYDRLKLAQTLENPNQKLHQFLTPVGEDILVRQIERVVNIMSSAATLEEATRLIHQSCTGQYQLGLFS